jgi:hypothetical protein
MTVLESALPCSIIESALENVFAWRERKRQALCFLSLNRLFDDLMPRMAHAPPFQAENQRNGCAFGPRIQDCGCMIVSKRFQCRVSNSFET